MPRRNSPHPSLRRQPEQPLKHGDAYEEPEDVLDDDEDEEDPDFSAERRDQPDDRLGRIEREMELLRRENDDLRRRVPPANAVRPEPEEEPDWDELLFKDPKQALKLHGERVAKQVSQELRSEYQRDQGTTEFWRDFYRDNKDLKDDDDIVQMVLSTNLDKLGGMPVATAMAELADLTRKRIMSYSNRKGRKPGDRTAVEGASAPSTRRAAPVEHNVVTLSDIIKNRRLSRRKAASAA